MSITKREEVAAALLEVITSWQWELFLRIVLACIVGIAIGLERRNRNKLAGVRTHAIVAFGAALMMVVSKYGFTDIPNYDASRIAAQIVSGIGFLGTGIIIVRNNSSVSGLTTAAGLWVTAGVGMSIGAGQYFLSISSALLLICMQIAMHKVGFLANEPYAGKMKMSLSSIDKVDIVKQFIQGEKICITMVKLNKLSDGTVKLEMDLLFPAKYDKMAFLEKLGGKEYIVSISA
ncbi:MgtC/SapB family protein [Parablautia muri]|uniref:MgtC/SapB family protein n=1 Tax=Parablautia muri TaxID=2320879 RepID=A0A9X5GR54_9FIRM|nr:MgtC/SapB family protein [Parablautia muri]NBJ91826.1 MgtC/SapB family protein [Parablautia muri]